MCRSIKPLFNFNPPATDEEIKAASLQFVRKLSGFQKPSEVNKQAFDNAVEKISINARKLLTTLATNVPPRNREVEQQKAIIRFAKRFNK